MENTKESFRFRRKNARLLEASRAWKKGGARGQGGDKRVSERRPLGVARCSVSRGSVRSRGGAWGEARRSLEKRGEVGGCQVGLQCVSVGERSRDAERRSVANQRPTWGPPPGKGAKWGPQPGRVCRSQGGPGCSFERQLAERASTIPPYRVSALRERR